VRALKADPNHVLISQLRSVADEQGKRDQAVSFEWDRGDLRGGL